MQVKHKLSPTMAEFSQQAVKQLGELRNRWLMAMGSVKEIEGQIEVLNTSVNQQVAIIRQAEGLPAPLNGYQLSPDCQYLIGEVADPPASATTGKAVADVVEMPAAAELGGPVNGAAHERT